MIEKRHKDLDLTEAEITLLTQTADRKARELGYEIEKMNFVLAKEGEAYKAFYAPKGKRILGGELHIYLDKNGNILRVLYGP